MNVASNEHVCLFCRRTLNEDDEVDVQLTTTTQGNINLEEFVKKSVLKLEMNDILYTSFLCAGCFDSINEMEGYLIRSRNIQVSFINQYIKSNQRMVPKEEIEDIESSEEPLSVYVDTAKRTSKRTVGQNKVNYVETNDVEESNADSNKQDISDDKTYKDRKIAAKAPTEYCCELCGKQYTTYSGFCMHRRKHRNENLFRCDLCNKTFTQKVNLTRHNYIHEGNYQYECETCGKKYIHESSFKLHKAAHEGIRNNQCDVCGMRFVSTSHLYRHVKTHTKRKEHACPECGKLFAERYNMTSHMKIHRKQHESSSVC